METSPAVVARRHRQDPRFIFSRLKVCRRRSEYSSEGGWMATVSGRPNLAAEVTGMG